MLDDIGLGNAIANTIYLIIILLGIGGAWFFIRRKNKVCSIFWISITLNFFAYLYFMGVYSFYPKYFYFTINQYWPWLNVAFFVLLIINFSKKNDQTKEGDNTK